MAVDTQQYYGQVDPTSTQGEWNKLRFIIEQQMLGLNTCLPVRVLSVQASGVAPVGFVSIQILVDQITGNDMTVPHGEITNVPYMRLQGGANAVIIDPSIGDVGIACFSSRDISAVKNAIQSSLQNGRSTFPPGSRRAYSFSDAMYIGGMLNAAPTQYIQFAEGGIIVHSPVAVTVEAPAVTVNATTINSTGSLTHTGNASFIGTMTNNGVNIGSTHTHTGSPSAPNGPVSPTGQPI